MTSPTLFIIAFENTDRVFAENIVETLANFGFEGQLYEFHTLSSEIFSKAEHVILIFSANAALSNTWQDILDTAIKMQKPFCTVRADETPLPEILAQNEWVDFSLGFQVGINGLVYAMRNPKTPSSDATIHLKTMAAVAQQRINRATLIAFVMWIVGMVVLALIFENF